MNNLSRFSLASLASKEFDRGKILAAFDQALQRCFDDCADRPAAEDSRKLTLALTMKPRCDERGRFDTVDVEVQVVDKLPARRSKVYSMKAGPDGVYYNEFSADNPHQATLVHLPGGERVDRETGEVVAS